MVENTVNDHERFDVQMGPRVTDITHYHVPNDSLVVAAIVRCRQPDLSLNPIALYHKIFGDEGTVIRMMQLSPDSWRLLGYRCERGNLVRLDREGVILLDAEGSSKHPTNLVNHTIDLLGNGSAGYKENLSEHKHHVRDACRKHVNWLGSNEERLLSYKDKMKMDWHNIYSHFPDRTPGAVKLRYHILRRQR